MKNWLSGRKPRTVSRVLRDTTHLGPFVDLRLLSDKGGMARIYRARNSETNRDCVLKVLRSEMLGNPEVVKKFRREADILQAIKQAAPAAPVVSVYSTGMISSSFVELPYIEMEFIPGGTDLSDYLRQRERVDPEVAATIVAQIVRALRCAYGIAVHRDLKPGNIMLANGDPCQVVVCDFGVAKEIDSRSVSHSAFGTAAFMAPEQCVPEGRVSWATDVYALGVIWYRMLTGGLLFDDPNPLVVMRFHAERDPRPLIEAAIPEPYAALLLRMLAKDPAARPGFDELARLLPDAGRMSGFFPQTSDISAEQTAILGSRTPVPLAGREGPALRSQGKARRLALTAAGIAAVALTALWWVLHQPPLGEPRKEPARPPGPRIAPPQAPLAPAGARWEISSVPAGAEVRIDDSVAGRTPLATTLVPGEHRVRVALDGYESFASPAQAKAGQAGTLHAVLVPKAASLSLTSVPAGAAIAIDGTARGVAPIRVDSLKAGKYRVTASLAGHPSQERWIPLGGGQQTTITFNFEEERGFLSVHSPRAAAEVFLDEKSIGSTPIDRLPLSVGQHALVARAAGFSEYRTNVGIQRGAERSVDIPLEVPVPASGFLTVDVQPPGAAVYVDGRLVGQTPLADRSLLVGDHLLSVKAPGRRPLERRLLITAGKAEEVGGELTPVIGTVEVVSEPPGFEVHFDGVPRGRTPLVLADQPHGRHQIALVLGGRLRWQGEVNIDGSREREIVRPVITPDEPEPRAVVNGSISVNVTEQGRPSWGTVFVDGNNVGSSPVLLKELPPQEYRIRVLRPGFQRKDVVVTLSSGEKKLVTVDIVPE